MFVYTIDDIISVIMIGILAIAVIVLTFWALISNMTDWIQKRVNRRREHDSQRRNK